MIDNLLPERAKEAPAGAAAALTNPHRSAEGMLFLLARFKENNQRYAQRAAEMDRELKQVRASLHTAEKILKSQRPLGATNSANGRAGTPVTP